MSKRYVGAIDQGTTSTRFLVFDKPGRIVSSHQLEHAQIHPQPGWVEHDPEAIWDNTRRVIEGALQKAGVQAEELAAIGVTNQRETTLIWNRKTGKPYYNAIVWQDTRTKDLCGELTEEGGPDRFRPKTGLPVSTYFSATKLSWLLQNIPETRADAEKGDALFGTMDTWLLWWLTGGPDGGKHVTDVTNASRTLLFNLEELSWDDELLAVFGIPPQVLPRILPSIAPGTFGETKLHGLSREPIPLTGILGDQQAALFGQACFAPGETKNTYGTGCFMLTNTGAQIVPSEYGLITTVAYQIGESRPAYALEGSVAIAGALVQWLRDNLGLIEQAQDIEALARGVPDNGGLYYVPAFSGLFAPYWKVNARGVMAGLTHSTNKGHLARAVLEATAFQTREIFEAMQKDTKTAIPSLKVDGGMVANELLMQFQADMLGIPVILPGVSETTALGACYAAGLATGFWADTDELRENWRQEREWTCRMPLEEREALYASWLKAVSRSFDWLD